MKDLKTLSVAMMHLLIAALGCTEKPNSITMITSPGRQDSIFRQLMTVTGSSLPDNTQNDSLAFLILPVQASCPSCRKKTVDSIVKHQNNLPNNHFIIITANGGRKSMSSYFREQNAKMPDIPQMILDTIDQAHKFELFENNPAIYYAVNRKVYKKVLALPATVKEDLQEFFSGSRNVKSIAKKD